MDEIRDASAPEPVLPALEFDETLTSYGRAEDLQAQIEQLDARVFEARELLEQQRLEHATAVARLRLEADNQLDDLRREEAARLAGLHDSYRALLSERLLEYEQGLSRAAASSARSLEAEQQRHKQMLEEVQSRQNGQDLAKVDRALAEADERHAKERHGLEAELAQARAAISRMQTTIKRITEQADRANAENAEYAVRVVALERRVEQQTEVTDTRSQAQNADFQRRAELAEKRLADERRRAAATLADLMEQSGALAAQMDKDRQQYATDRQRIEAESSAAASEAAQRYELLAAAADDRAVIALEREAELEALIADLRRKLGTSPE